MSGVVAMSGGYRDRTLSSHGCKNSKMAKYKLSRCSTRDERKNVPDLGFINMYRQRHHFHTV